ncbi:hypothetical protein WN943_017292 [Citrus x changshan-huyou]
MVSEAAFIRGSQVLGIIPRVLKPLGSSSDSSTREELVVSGMQERITEMLNHADAFVFLPGDLATLEALMTLASWAHLHIHQKPIEFVEAAIDLGRSIAARNLHLVYGGGNRGLSKMVSEAAFIRGSQVLGIIPRVLKPLGSSSDSSTREELVVSGMQERITEMLNHADAFVFLPGDLATLEALMTLASWAHLHIHQKPIATNLILVYSFYSLVSLPAKPGLLLLLFVLSIVSIGWVNSHEESDINGSEFSLLPALDPHAEHEYKSEKMNVKALHDGHDVYFLLQVDGEYAYSKGENTRCPSIALMFQIGEDATYHNMGGCKKGTGSCTSKTCKGHEVDIMYFSIESAIPGRLYDGNPVDNSEGNGGDRFGHLVDVYVWTPHCRYLDGMGPSGIKLNHSRSFISHK